VGAATVWSWQNYISQMLKQQDQQLSKAGKTTVVDAETSETT